MNKAQKIARFRLIVLTVAVMAIGIWTVVIMLVYHQDARVAYKVPGGKWVFFEEPTVYMALGVVFAGIVFFGLPSILLAGLLPLILFRAKQGQVAFDERDLLIDKKATLIAYQVAWFSLVAACPILICIAGGADALIPAVVFLPAVFGEAMVFLLVHSIEILLYYGGKDKKT